MTMYIPLDKYPRLEIALKHGLRFTPEANVKVRFAEAYEWFHEVYGMDMCWLRADGRLSLPVGSPLPASTWVYWSLDIKTYAAPTSAVISYGKLERPGEDTCVVCVRVAELNKLPHSPKRERRLMTPKLRHQVLERDGFRCCHCGASPKERRLEVDHIHPVSKGGRTTLDNLQTLCRLCNAGKFNFLPTDPPLL